MKTDGVQLKMLTNSVCLLINALCYMKTDGVQLKMFTDSVCLLINALCYVKTDGVQFKMSEFRMLWYLLLCVKG